MPWSGAPDCPVTVQSQTRHSRVSQGALRYNSPDFPVCYRTVRCTSGATTTRAMVDCKSRVDRWTVKNSARRVRAQKSDVHRTVNSACPVPLKDKPPMVNCSITQKVGWRGWRTGQRPVRPSTAAIPNSYVVVEGYKYPPTTTTPSIQVSSTSHSIQELVHSLLGTIQ
jgi:hypothetical protein